MVPWMNRFAKRVSHWTRDGVSLSKQLWMAENSVQRRAALLTAASDGAERSGRGSGVGNIWAISFLKMEKEVNLMQYHGLSGYIRQMAMLGGTKASSRDTSTAKVAFMITSTQRKELHSILGYSNDQIKALNPAEAQIILQHRLPPTAEGRTKLQQFLQQSSAEEDEHLPAASSTNGNASSYTTSSQQSYQNSDIIHNHLITQSVTSQMTSDMSSSLAVLNKMHDQTIQDEQGDHLQQDLPTSNKTTSSKDANHSIHHTQKGEEATIPIGEQVWYEVFQQTTFQDKKTGEQVTLNEAIALYKTKSEAEDCVNIKQKHAKSDISFSIQKKMLE